MNTCTNAIAYLQQQLKATRDLDSFSNMADAIAIIADARFRVTLSDALHMVVTNA